MRRLLPGALVLAFLAAGCGTGDGPGGRDVPADAIAVCGEREVARSEYDALISQAERSYRSQKREFPKEGTPERATLKNQAVQFLVQRCMFEEKADELGVEVSEADVNKRLDQIKEQYFEGDDQRYREQLEQQGLTEEQVRKDIRAQLLQERLFERVSEDVQVTDADVEEYYRENIEQYRQAESRDVRHILVKTKELADRLYAQLRGGADFAALAKRHSEDPGSSEDGGELTVVRGQTVPEFDEVAFELERGELSRPVKTQFGWHVIQALSEVKPARTTPLREVRDDIREQLVQTRRNEAMTKWVEDLKKEFADEIGYAEGFEPPEATTTTRRGTTVITAPPPTARTETTTTATTP